MAGCEYLPSIPRMGLKVALKHFQKFDTVDKIIEALKLNKAFKEKIPDGYIDKHK